MWSVARAQGHCDTADTKDVRYASDVEAECIRVGVKINRANMRGGKTMGCTTLDKPRFTVLSLRPTEYEMEHEKSHRMCGDWHPGYVWFTRWQWKSMLGT